MSNKNFLKEIRMMTQEGTYPSLNILLEED